MNQKLLDEDRRELEAHFAERVQAYIELGETPEEALISAREKFGQTEAVVQELHQQRTMRSPLVVASLGALLWFALTTFSFVLMVSAGSFLNVMGVSLPPALTVVLSILALCFGVLLPAFLAGHTLGYRFPQRRGAALAGIVLPGVVFTLWLGIVSLHSSWVTIAFIVALAALGLKRGAAPKRGRA
jgi:hypothetical protein